ncbi:MAG: hypothetical protein U0L88_08200 [Acutalibacteraceae bacterium]|nr:hypothetical protein [Acutalibacteraceae bacterium]
MAKCKNEKFMSTIGVNKLTKNVEIDFDVQRNLPDCQKINAGKYISTTASSPRYDRFKIPKNQFECMQGACVNSGTLFASAGAENVYKFKLDATEFAAGVLTFYALGITGNAEVTISDTAAFTNADKYTINLADMAHGEDGYTAVVVDFSQEPTDIGSGWNGQGENIYVKVKLSAATGISTLAMFESMDDFAVSTHVIARCMSSIDGSWDLDVAEQTCFKKGQYDTSELNGFEKTVSYKAITPNFWRLNAMYKKGSLTKAWDKETVEATVKALTGTDYGYITLDDIDQSECGFTSIQVLYDCRDSQSASDAMLERLAIPSKIDMDEDHYQMVDNGDGTTTILFNQVHIGRSVLISYPKVVDVTDSFEFTDEMVNEVRTRMSYVKCFTDGSKYRFVYNNVLVTSFPDALSEDDEAEGELTLNIQRDANGRFCYAYRIIG